MKGMHFPIHVILTSLKLYFLNNSSTRSISQFFMIKYNGFIIMQSSDYKFKLALNLLDFCFKKGANLLVQVSIVI